MGLTKEQFELSLKDPVAFHKYVLGNPMKLTQPQVDVRGTTDYGQKQFGEIVFIELWH